MTTSLLLTAMHNDTVFGLGEEGTARAPIHGHVLWAEAHENAIARLIHARERLRQAQQAFEAALKSANG